MIVLNQKGQGTIEYLVIVAIIIVIALVVVGLLLQIMNQGSGISETTAKTAWRTAEPWAIIDWSRNANDVTIVLQNNTFENLSLNYVKLNANDQNTTATTNVAPGAKVTRIITEDTVGCTAGSKYSIEKSGIQIDFNTPNITGRKQYGVSNIIGTC